jgi:hypothetical protein
MIVYPKEVILATLKDFFSKDSYYHYSKDQWGFCNVTDHTDLPLGADVPIGEPGSTSNQGDLLSTRLFIGENYHFDGIYYPAILVKSGGMKYVPISINREKGSVQYGSMVYVDGYGNQKIVRRPISFITAGIFEGSIVVDILTRSLRARDDLVERIAMCFAEIHVDSLYDVGLIVKPPNISAPSESEDRNDKLFKQSVTMDIRTEYRREIPVGNIIDAIFFTATFEDLSRPEQPVPQNLTINTDVSILDILLNV